MANGVKKDGDIESAFLSWKRRNGHIADIYGILEFFYLC